MEIKQIENIHVTAKKDEQIQLPKKAKVQLADGAEIDLHVEWEDFDEQKINELGEHIIKGNVMLKQFKNPLIEQRADPYLYKHIDGYYYFMGSHPLFDRIVLRRAKTIEELPNAEEQVIWWKHESGAMSKHIWAPEIHYIDDKWYVHYAAGKIDDEWAIRPYVLECKDPDPLTGKWEEKGQVNINFESFSLDATTFEHRGKHYLIWAQKVANDSISNLYIAELENQWTIKGEQVLLSTPELAWETIGFHVNEGAAVIKRNGRIFITYSGSATDHNYAMGRLTASEDSDVLDPNSWEKDEEPIFVTNEEASEFGPGHNSFSVAEDDETDLIIYHSRPYKEIQGNSLYDHNRHARIQEVFWDQNGRPYLGKPGQSLHNTETGIQAIITRK